MLSKNNLINLSENTNSNDSVIVLGGCGSLQVHPDIVSFLEKQGLEVYHHNRSADKLLGEHSSAILNYLQEIRNSINILLEKGKRVHIYANSFGGYLAMQITGEANNNISSAVVIAPIIDPIKSINIIKSSKQDNENTWIKLPDGRDFPILNTNMEFLANNKVELFLPLGLIIIGNKDEIIDYKDIQSVSGSKLNKYVLEGVNHGNISSHIYTKSLMEDFYSQFR
ncbi:MAG: hypothetical protein PHS49_03510 [Candidatus Gracilibacteria bacterium]|nr:hypothetical protein [Candidatus Gracilibacteria bacterium]